MSAKIVAFESVAYPDELRRTILEARSSGSIRFDELAQLGRSITLLYADAVRRAMQSASISSNGLTALGAHGQTLFHDPPNTIQWLDPSLLANEIGCAVVSDFRRADLAAGGQGAPLVPFADFILFRSATHEVVTINIGGISNVTWLRCNGSIDDVIAFDCGPGNCVSDWLCRTFDPGGVGFDVDGQIALSGTPIATVVGACLGDPYFGKPPPKSTDGPAMISIFERAWKSMAPQATLPDLLASSTQITAWTILKAMMLMPAFQFKVHPRKFIGAGGGFSNRAIVRELRARTDPLGIEACMTDELNIHPMAREALAFALLTAATIDGETSNVPSATGASRRVILGSITPAQSQI